MVANKNNVMNIITYVQNNTLIPKKLYGRFKVVFPINNIICMIPIAAGVPTKAKINEITLITNFFVLFFLSFIELFINISAQMSVIYKKNR